MDALSDLPDHARIRLLPVAPALDEASATALLGSIDKLFSQFAREGRVTRWAAECLGGGAMLALAYLGNDEISGCSHDKLNRLLLAHEHDGERQLLAAPPIVVEIAGVPRCLDRPSLRQLVASGAITASSLHWDVRMTTLGEWRTAGRRPITMTWLAALVPGIDPVRSGR